MVSFERANIHKHAGSYESLGIRWTINGTATRLDNCSDIDDWGVDSSDGNGTNTVLICFQAQTGQTIILRPTYKISHTGLPKAHNFAFYCLIEKVISR